MNKLLVVALFVCVLALSEASVRVFPRCPRRARARSNVHLGAMGRMDVRGSGSVAWSVCDNLGRCNRGSDHYSGKRTVRTLNMFFMAYYSRPGGYSVTARLTAGGRTAIGRCSFVVS